MSDSPQPPHLVRADDVTYTFLCQYCIRAKNNVFVPDRGWARGEGLDDITMRGEIPVEAEELWATCSYGHQNLVLRAGSQRARNFGFG
jgi:hypothetical protein